MLFLLRNIRRKLLSSNQLVTYLLYAIGEIFLVVVGILIAVSIDDWNEERIKRQKEIHILKDLQAEFLKNKESLQKTIIRNQISLEALEVVLQLMDQPESVLNKYNVDSLIFLTLEYDDFNPSQSVINEIISSGKMNLITSDTLRMLIFDWVAAMDEEEESYTTLDQVSQSMMLPYLAKNGTMKNLDFYGLLPKYGKSKFISSNQALFQQLEFENNMDNQAWGITNYLNRLNSLDQLIEALIYYTGPASQ